MFHTHRLHNRLHRTLRIARLLARLRLEVLPRLPRRLPVIHNLALRLHPGPPQKVRPKRPRLHHRHMHAQRLHLRRQRLREPLHSKLRRVIKSPPRRPDQPTHRRQIHNIPRPPFPKMRQHLLRQIDQPHQVRLEHRQILFLRHLLDRSRNPISRVIHQHIHMPRTRHRIRHRAAHIVRLRHIQLQNHRIPRIPHHQRLQLVHLPRRRHHRRTQRTQILRHQLPKSRRRSRDHPNLALLRYSLSLARVAHRVLHTP